MSPSVGASVTAPAFDGTITVPDHGPPPKTDMTLRRPEVNSACSAPQQQPQQQLTARKIATTASAVQHQDAAQAAPARATTSKPHIEHWRIAHEGEWIVVSFRPITETTVQTWLGLIKGYARYEKEDHSGGYRTALCRNVMYVARWEAGAGWLPMRLGSPYAWTYPMGDHYHIFAAHLYNQDPRLHNLKTPFSPIPEATDACQPAATNNNNLDTAAEASHHSSVPTRMPLSGPHRVDAAERAHRLRQLLTIQQQRRDDIEREEKRWLQYCLWAAEKKIYTTGRPKALKKNRPPSTWNVVKLSPEPGAGVRQVNGTP
jgi:hypothetical protein